MAVELVDPALVADTTDIVLQTEQTWGGIEDVTGVLVDNPEIWLGAAAGGAFGAALGALPAFVFTGFLVLAGMAGGGMVGVGFGPVFGPHISFAGGAAAAAYAAKNGIMESGMAYHNGKDITFALGTRPDVLTVGAAFGLFGIALEQTFRNLAVPTDPIAFTVVASAFLHRAVFGYSILGVVSDKASGRFDMGPFEREEMGNNHNFGDGEKDNSEMLAVEPWLGHQYKWSHVATIGAFAGAAAAYAGLQIAGAYDGAAAPAVFFGFGLSAASLLFLNLGVAQIPVTHHMTLPGATAYFAVTLDVGNGAILSGADPIVGILMAAIFGLLGGVVAEAGQRIFYAHGATHVDPPAFAIFITISIIWLLAFLGVFETSVWVPGGL
ncbi:hypothetical protein [Halapricum desulfuricans]|uniref:Putative membrane protein n=1 Tax=Halapricum desulfuricans TaxID=2841257 RepID=A0A897N6D2_9EURY|nr:hypothetical protein [Halapricum desulfuricans]QSG08267.1 putative membrane protein [Halapricum desulfuricans]